MIAILPISPTKVPFAKTQGGGDLLSRFGAAVYFYFYFGADAWNSD